MTALSTCLFVLLSAALAVPVFAADPDLGEDAPPPAFEPRRVKERPRRAAVRPAARPASEPAEAPPSPVSPPAPPPAPASPEPAPVTVLPAGDERLRRLIDARAGAKTAAAAPAVPSTSALLGRWTIACGRGQRQGTMLLTSIRPDGKAVGTFTGAGITNGRAEAAIRDGQVDFILRWSVFFVHGRIHGFAPATQLLRSPIHIEGQWEGTNLENLSSDFEATRLGP